MVATMVEWMMIHVVIRHDHSHRDLHYSQYDQVTLIRCMIRCTTGVQSGN